ncbi:hypothetical protein BJ912DRAFT_1055121 [Pholiota molesta]|nr:hypothetical protein BJ912DRAFT_1055121 [Pholiota molesta]
MRSPLTIRLTADSQKLSKEEMMRPASLYPLKTAQIGCACTALTVLLGRIHIRLLSKVAAISREHAYALASVGRPTSNSYRAQISTRSAPFGSPAPFPDSACGPIVSVSIFSPSALAPLCAVPSTPSVPALPVIRTRHILTVTSSHRVRTTVADTQETFRTLSLFELPYATCLKNTSWSYSVRVSLSVCQRVSGNAPKTIKAAQNTASGSKSKGGKAVASVAPGNDNADSSGEEEDFVSSVMPNAALGNGSSSEDDTLL